MGPARIPVTIRVTDSAGATAETSFTITVTEGNTAPVLAAISNQSVAEGSPVAVTASATDADLPAQTLDLQPGHRADGCDDRRDDGCVHLDAWRSRWARHASGHDPRDGQRRGDRGDELHDYGHRGQRARRCWPRSAISRWRKDRPSP